MALIDAGASVSLLLTLFVCLSLLLLPSFLSSTNVSSLWNQGYQQVGTNSTTDDDSGGGVKG